LLVHCGTPKLAGEKATGLATRQPTKATAIAEPQSDFQPNDLTIVIAMGNMFK
jgi:hypothetical protein